LAFQGFLVVATPYQLSFDYLEASDQVLSKFERMAPDIARQYGAIPVVGIGHSCGALLQLLITCLFPDTPRAANALISYNNKPVSDAIPFFEEFFAPAFTQLANDTNMLFPINSNDALSLWLRLLKSATEEGVPSDELLQEAARIFYPPPLFSKTQSSRPEEIQIPEEFRDSVSKLVAPQLKALSEAGVLPILNQAIHTLEQIPKLITEVRTYVYTFAVFVIPFLAGLSLVACGNKSCLGVG
jgi:hypothetical protein